MELEPIISNSSVMCIIISILEDQVFFYLYFNVQKKWNAVLYIVAIACNILIVSVYISAGFFIIIIWFTSFTVSFCEVLYHSWLG